MTVLPYEPPPPLPASMPGDELAEGPRGWVARLRGAAEYAGYIADTEFVPQQLRGRPAAIAAAILYGAEVGLEPMQSLNAVSVIKGKPALSAEAQRGLVNAAGHRIWFDESTPTRAIAAGQRQGEERIQRITWTLDDAKRAGIAGGENWRRYPAEMLRARASAALARTMFADVIGGMAASEELDGEPDNGAPLPEPVDDKPRSSSRTRKRSRAAVAPTPPPDPQPEPEIPKELPASLRRKIFATFSELGRDSNDRPARLAELAKIVGREIKSTNELTPEEASTVINTLERQLEEQREKTLLEEINEETSKPKEAQTPTTDDIPF